MKFPRSLAIGVGLGLLAPIVGSGTVGATPTSDAVDDAVTWLATQQQSDGGFEVAGFPGFETSDVVLALASSGTTEWDSAAALARVQAVQNGGLDGLDELDDLVDNEATPSSVAAGARAAKITALVAQPLGLDASDFDPSNDSASPVDLLDRIDQHRNLDGSYDFSAQFNGVLYTAIALAGEGTPIPAALVDQIRAAQRSDGSWDYTGTTTGGGEDIDTTALALTALRSAGLTVADADIAAGVAFLAARQQPSGAWAAFGADDPNSTSMATLALSDLRIDVSTPAWRADAGAPVTGSYTSPIAWLAAQQANDGHIASPNDLYGINTFATAQSTQAMGQQWYLHTEHRELLDAWSQELASPAASPATGFGESDGMPALGVNASTTSARLAGASAVLAGQDGREAAAADLFQAAFNRALDPSGRAYWSGRLAVLSRPEVLARLTGSNEYFRRANSSIPTFVDHVYQSVLGRSADPSGRAYWISRLQSGRSVQSVARALTASAEYRRIQVRTSYDRVLDRQPTAIELGYWSEALRTIRVEALLARIASSAERYGALAG